MIWRDLYIEAVNDHGAIKTLAASALHLDVSQVAVVPDEEAMPLAGTAQAVIVLRPCVGDFQAMASIYLFGNPDRVAQEDDHAFAQALADGLACSVLLPDDNEPNASLFLRFRPGLPVGQVALDPERLDDESEVCIVNDGGLRQGALS